MNLFCYMALDEKPGQEVLQLIEAEVSRTDLEVYRTTKAFAMRLQKPVDEVAIAILLPEGHVDLMRLRSMNRLSNEIPVLIIINDRGPDTIAIAHRLRPRYLSFTDSNIKTIPRVLNKMIEKQKQKIFEKGQPHGKSE